jgi:hypothetical protein
MTDTNRGKVVDYIVNFLNKNSSDYRYQIFGLRKPIGDVYFYTNAPTLDTDFFGGRRIDWLVQSGEDTIDQSHNLQFLQTFLLKSREFSVKYIFTLDDFHYNFLKNSSWKILDTKSFNTTKVALWENPQNVEKVKVEKEEITFQNYLWGTVPILTLVVFVILLIKPYLIKKK